VNKRIITLLNLLLIIILAACGKQEQAPTPASTTQQSATPAPTTAEATSTIKEGKGFTGLGYRVVDAFNVGKGTYVRSMALDHKKNVLWIGTSIGVLEVDGNTRNMLHTYNRDQGLANEYVFGIMVDNDGEKWFGTNGGGISRFKDGQWKTYFPMHGLADYWVYSFAQQANGTIWIGTWAGLNAFDKKTEKFTTYLKELVNEWVYGLAVDSKDHVWIGTEGGVNMFDGKTWKAWTHKDGLGAPNTENLPLSSNSGLGTRSRHNLSPMQFGQKTYNPNYVFALVTGKDDSVWAGTWGGGVSHYDGKTWTNYTTKDGLAGNIVYSLARDANGVLWFGTDSGLTRYDGEHWVTFNHKDGLLDDSIYAVVVTDKNEVWVGSRSGVTVLSDK